MASTPRKLTNALSVGKYLRQFLDSCAFNMTTATLTTNAATITSRAARITTESLTTAHTAAETLVITCAGVEAGDMAMVSMCGGTNTGGVPVFHAVCTADTITITLRNNAIATNAFNGTFIFNLLVFKQ